MTATDLAIIAFRTAGDTEDGIIVDNPFDLLGDSLEELQNVDLTKADNDLFNSLIDGKSADKRKLNGDGTILSVVQNVTTVWALQAGEYVSHVYIGTTGTWTDNLGGDVDNNWFKCDIATVASKTKLLEENVNVSLGSIATGVTYNYFRRSHKIIVGTVELSGTFTAGQVLGILPYTFPGAYQSAGSDGSGNSYRFQLNSSGEIKIIDAVTTSSPIYVSITAIIS